MRRSSRRPKRKCPRRGPHIKLAVGCWLSAVGNDNWPMADSRCPMPPTPPAIDISHLAHRYGEHIAIRDLSLTVATGEIFALLGPNGSGKTTLFRVLSTLIPIQQGDVHIFGGDLRTEAD